MAKSRNWHVRQIWSNIKHVKLHNYELKFYFKRLAACFYKQNRQFFHLYKSCFFKICCTFLVVVIQKMCDRNYKLCNNNPIAEHDLTTDTSDEESKQLTKIKVKKEKIKKTKKVSQKNSCNQTNFCDQCIVGQPQPCHYPKEKLCCSDRKVNFNTQTSTLQFPPSFNLKSNQKSTPKRQQHICNDTSVQIDPNLTETSNQTKTNAESKLKKGQIETTIEVHESNDSNIEIDESFHSL